MSKQQVTWQLDPDTIKKVKELADLKGWAIQVTADKLLQKALKTKL
jgi:hypothetical protein